MFVLRILRMCELGLMNSHTIYWMPFNDKKKQNVKEKKRKKKKQY